MKKYSDKYQYLFIHGRGHFYIRHRGKKFSLRTRDPELAIFYYKEYFRRVFELEVLDKVFPERKPAAAPFPINQAITGNAPDNDLIKPLYTTYLETAKRKQFSAHTMSVKRRVKRYLIEAGVKRFDEIDQDRINKLLDTWNKNGIAEDSKKKYCTELRCFLNFAIKHDKYDERAYRRLEFPRFVTKVRDTVISPTHFSLILDTLRDNDTDLYFYLQTLYYTASRPAEVVDLTPSAIDFDEGIISVFMPKVKKTKKVPVETEFLNELRAYIDSQGIDPDKPIFDGGKRDEDGQYITSRQYYGKKFQKLTKNLKLKPYGYTLYTYRHTRATHLMTKLGDPKAVAYMLGQKGVKTLMTHYDNRTLEDLQGAIRGL